MFTEHMGRKSKNKYAGLDPCLRMIAWSSAVVTAQRKWLWELSLPMISDAGFGRPVIAGRKSLYSTVAPANEQAIT